MNKLCVSLKQAQRLVFCLGGFCFLYTTAQAESNVKETDALVISANRYSTPASKVSSSVTVITEEDIAKLQVDYVHELLKTVPYLDVIQSGGQGGNVSIFIRGANSEHTLVLVDGMELNNPATTNRAVNLNNLTVDNIERIEILRGSQSMPYGSDALGGVIAIYTKTGGEQTQSIIDLSGGSYETWRSAAQTFGQYDFLKYSLAAAYDQSDGISAAAKSYGNSERDGYENIALSTKLAASLSDMLDLNLIGRYTDSEADIDNQGGLGGDDLNRKLDSEEVLLRGEVVGKFFIPEFIQTLGVSWSDHSTKDRNDPDTLSSDFLRSDFDGTLTKFDLLNRWEISNALTSTLGLETRQEEASSSTVSDGVFGPFEEFFPGQDMRTDAVFLDNIWSANEWLTFNAGGRYDDNSESGSEATYRFGPVVCLSDCTTRLSSNIGTGYKAPSLFQLFSAYGNQNLQAEESFNWDVGVEQELVADQLNAGVTFFRNTIDNLVTFDNQTFVFENVDKARIYGLEVFTIWELAPGWTWRNDYSYTDARNSNDQTFLLRRARNKFGTELATTLFDKKALLTVRATANDGRYDNDFSQFPAKRVKLSGYAIVDVNLSYKVSDAIELYGRVANLLDKEYEDVLGFGTPGVAAYGGVKVSL